jgi:hypothetical protein
MSCGGLIGRDCFNPQECAEISQAMAAEYHAQQYAAPLLQENERLRHENEQLRKELQDMNSKEQWVKEQIIDTNRGQGTRINNPNDDGLPIAVNIPGNMVYLADLVLREMCYRGNQSPELRIYLGEGGTGAVMWNCQYGATRTWSVTPWGALEKMGRQIESLAKERANGE